MKFFIRCILLSFILLASHAMFAATAPDIKAMATDKVTGDEAVGEKNVFTKNTPVIYITYEVSNIKPGQHIKGVWIAEETNNVAPANYQIDEKAVVAPTNGKAGDVLVGKFSLSKPPAGWPVGKYRVDIYLEQQLIKSVSFTVT